MKRLLLIASLFVIASVSASAYLTVKIQNNIDLDVIASIDTGVSGPSQKITILAGKQGEVKGLCFGGVTILDAKNKNVLAKFSNIVCEAFKDVNFVLEKPEGKDIQLIKK